MTIDGALLRQLAAQPNTKVRKDFTELAMQSIGMVLLKPTTVTELLDAYEERDRLRTALAYYAEPRNHHDDYLHTNDSYDDLKLPGSRARAALEGRE